MWSRIDLKNRAKAVLKTQYWNCLAVCVFLGIAGAGTSSLSSLYNRSTNNRSNNRAAVGVIGSIDYAVLAAVMIVILAVIAFAIVFRIFVGYHIEVGCRRYFINQCEYKNPQLKSAFGALNGAEYKSIIITMLKRSVYTFLWTLCLIIPGIIKAYSYCLVPYILADNPGIDSSEAIKRSVEMTNGYKMDIFVLELSFIGWQLLGMLLFCVGVIFVAPYVNVTLAEMYIYLRDNGGERTDFVANYEYDKDDYEDRRN